MQPERYRLCMPMRVRWAEVDPQRVVFNGHYLTYADTASTEYWRAIGAPYPDGLAKQGGDVYVRKATLEFHAPARYDDRVEVCMRCAGIGNSSLRFDWEVRRRHTSLVSGELVYVFADLETQRPAPVPPALRAAIEAFERGEAMYRLRVGSWTDLAHDASAIRGAVFIEEQRIDAALERDGLDPSCTHAIVCNRFGEAVATARSRALDDATVKLERVAVVANARGAGVGRLLVEGLIDDARARGVRLVSLHAQASAARFFGRLGFSRHGEAFEEAGIAHIEMRCHVGHGSETFG